MRDTDLIHQAAELIKQGGVIAFPTETVYGLGADALNPLAVARIFEIKNRPYFDPLIVHIANFDEMSRLVINTPADAKKLIKRFWPGPLTLVLSKTDEVPDLVTAGLPTVAIRMPKHPISLQLINDAGCPIAAPSANPFGYVSPTTATHVRDLLGSQVDLILDGGPCEVGLESTIISFAEEKPRLLRPGGLPIEEIEPIIGKVEIDQSEEDSPSSPGRLPRHYAPRTPIVIEEWKRNLEVYQNKKVGLLSFQEGNLSFPFQHVEVLSQRGDLREAAATLFAAVRRLDILDLDLILVEAVPEVGLGRAIMDRLRRASRRSEVHEARKE
jgi:L-threonylcarbamoyladenylate synthase